MIRRKLVTGPIEEPLTLEDAKAHLRVDGDAEDVLITALIRAAREQVEHETGRAMMTQTWDVSFDAWPAEDVVELPVPPVQSISSVSYVDGSGTTQTWSSAQWSLDASGIESRLVLGYGLTWPVARDQRNAITVRCVCGYSSAEAVPQALKQWMLLAIARMFELREPVVVGQAATELGFVDRLLDPYRVPRVA